MSSQCVDRKIPKFTICEFTDEGSWCWDAANNQVVEVDLTPKKNVRPVPDNVLKLLMMKKFESVEMGCGVE